MTLSLTEDIHSITELKKNAKNILNQMRRTGRPIVLTVNGKADAVLLDVKTYEKTVQVKKLADLLAEAEQDVSAKKTRPIRKFLKEFKDARKIPS